MTFQSEQNILETIAAHTTDPNARVSSSFYRFNDFIMRMNGSVVCFDCVVSNKRTKRPQLVSTTDHHIYVSHMYSISLRLICYWRCSSSSSSQRRICCVVLCVFVCIVSPLSECVCVVCVFYVVRPSIRRCVDSAKGRSIGMLLDWNAWVACGGWFCLFGDGVNKCM